MTSYNVNSILQMSFYFKKKNIFSEISSSTIIHVLDISSKFGSENEYHHCVSLYTVY